MTDTVLRLRRGTENFLVSKITGIIAAANADIANRVKANGPPPVFTVAIGDIPNPAGPTISISYIGAPAPDRNGDGLIFRTVRFKIACYVPLSGDCTPMNYEVALVTIADHFDTLMLDDIQMQVPTIDAGLIPNFQAYRSDLGEQRSIWPTKLADNITEVHGWATSWSATFSLKTK